MNRSKGITLRESIDKATEEKMRAAANFNEEIRPNPKIELDQSSVDLPLTKIESKLPVELNTILLDDGKGGAFDEAKERLKNNELRNSDWYKKLQQLFSEQQKNNYNEKFIPPEDCPVEVVGLFTEDILKQTQESKPIIEKEEFNLDSSAAELIRQSESYKDLLDLYITKEISLEELEDIYTDKTLQAKFIDALFREFSKVEESTERNKMTLDRQAALCLLQDIKSEKIKIAIKPETAPTDNDQPKNIKYPHGVVASFLGNLYIQGMEPYDIRRLLLVKSDEQAKDKLNDLASRYTDLAAIRDKIKDNNWNNEVEFFLKQLERGRGKDWGFDPAQRLLAEAVINQPAVGQDRQEFNAASIEEANDQFIQTAREVWRNFVYSGEWSYSLEKGFELKPDAGFDARITFFLLERAGITTGSIEGTTAKAVKPGLTKFGATNIDTKPLVGAKLEYLDNRPTLRIGNNPLGRTVAETSSAKIIYRLLTSSGLLDKKDQVLRVMAEIATDDDNGHLITTKEQFKKADKTFRGLVRGMDLFDLYSHITKQWSALGGEGIDKKGTWPDRQQAWREVYSKLLDNELTNEEIEIYNLSSNKRKLGERFRYTQEILNKPKEELVNEGRVIDTQYGSYVVAINNWWPRGQQYLAGHEGVRAYGYDGLIIYDPFNDSFKVNTVKPEVDLSKVWGSQRPEKRMPQGRADKGMMVTSYGEPLKISLKDILANLGGQETIDKARGYLKEFLDLEQEVDKVLADQKTEIEANCRQLYESWPKGAKARTKQDQDKEIDNLYRETLSEVRKQIYNEYIATHRKGANKTTK